MASTTTHTLVSEAAALQKKLRGGVNRLGALEATRQGLSPEEAHEMASSLGTLLKAHADVSHSSPSPEVVEAVRKQFHIPAEATIDSIRSHVEDRLGIAVEAAKESKALKFIEQAAAKGKAPVPEVAEAKTLISRVAEKHGEMLEKRSGGARIGISAAEVAAGAILLFQGAHWISQSLHGYEKTGTQTIENSEVSTFTTTKQPLTSTQRMLKGAMGIGAVVAGVGGFALGLQSLSHEGRGF